MECRPPCLSVVISLMSVLCVHFVIYQQLQQLDLPEAHSLAEHRWGMRYDPTITVHANHRPPSPLLHPDRAGRRVGSIFYGLRPNEHYSISPPPPLPHTVQRQGIILSRVRSTTISVWIGSLTLSPQASASSPPPDPGRDTLAGGGGDPIWTTVVKSRHWTETLVFYILYSILYSTIGTICSVCNSVWGGGGAKTGNNAAENILE